MLNRLSFLKIMSMNLYRLNNSGMVHKLKVDFLNFFKDRYICGCFGWSNWNYCRICDIFW